MKTFLYLITGLGIMGVIIVAFRKNATTPVMDCNDKISLGFIVRELPGLVVFERDGCQEGVSAAYSGVLGDAVVLAGGCNFPDVPAQKGGHKVYYQEIYKLSGPGRKENAWIKAGSLPVKAANGASVSVPEGVICIGGKNAEGALNNVWLLHWDAENETILASELASLPYPMDDLSAATDGHSIYVAGGNVEGQPGHKCLKLNGIEAEAWEELPDYPGPVRLQPVGLFAEKKFYLLGGFQPVIDGQESIVSTNVLCFDPETNQWTLLGDIYPCGEQESRTIIGGAGQLLGKDRILIVGGVHKSTFKSAVDNPVLQERAKKENLQTELVRLRQEKESYLGHEPEWYRFNRQILIYDLKNEQWQSVGDFSQLARAGASLVAYGDKWIVINGESKPGVRAANVYMIERRK